MVFTKILFWSECKLMHLRVLINCQVASGIDGRHSVFMVFFFFFFFYDVEPHQGRALWTHPWGVNQVYFMHFEKSLYKDGSLGEPFSLETLNCPLV